MKALIVDDEVVVRIGLKSIIDWQAEGFNQLFEASNGAEALSLAIHEEPELILTDIKMPEMDGLELIGALKREGVNACIVVLSSYDDYDFVRKAMGLGAMDYILKLQMTETSLRETLRSVLARYHVQASQDISGFSRNLQYLQSKMLKDALLYGGEAEKILCDMRKSLQLNIHFQRCALALLLYKRAGEAKQHEAPDRIFSSALLNTIGEILGDRYAYHSVELTTGKLCLVFAGEGMDFRTFAPYGTLIVEMLMNYINLESRICFSSVGEGGMHAAYLDAEAALDLQDIRPQPSSVTDTQILNLLPSMPERAQVFLRYRGSSEALLESALSDGDMFALRSKLEHRFDQALSLSDAAGTAFWAGLFSAAQAFAQLHELSLPLPDAPACFNLSASELRDHFEPLCQALCAGFEHASMMPKVIKDAMRYMQTHYHEHITAKDAAAYVGLSPSYFGSLFRRSAGVSPTAYIIDLRIQKAQQLLSKSSYHVYEIAEMVGYENSFYFNRQFKKITGCTPNEWRNR